MKKNEVNRHTVHNPIEALLKHRLIIYPSTNIRDRSLYWLGTCTSIKATKLKLMLLAQNRRS